MKSFSKVEKKRLPELVADEIEEAVIEGSFGVGSQLPSEQQLATQFGVSRNVVREAFKFLKERGLIEILNGSGAYVRQPSGGPTSDALGRYIRLIGAQASVAALYEARRTLEGANARFAAQRATPEDIAEISDCLTRMKEHAGSIARWSEADLDFHLAVAKATHNPFFSMLLEPLVDQLRGVIAEGYLLPGAVERGLDAHSKLLTCIKEGHSEGAYRTIMDHLSDSEAIVGQVNAQQAIQSQPISAAD